MNVIFFYHSKDTLQATVLIQHATVLYCNCASWTKRPLCYRDTNVRIAYARSCCYVWSHAVELYVLYNDTTYRYTREVGYMQPRSSVIKFSKINYFLYSTLLIFFPLRLFRSYIDISSTWSYGKLWIGSTPIISFRWTTIINYSVKIFILLKREFLSDWLQYRLIAKLLYKFFSITINHLIQIDIHGYRSFGGIDYATRIRFDELQNFAIICECKSLRLL